MTELSHRNFGLLIAYVIPGLVVVFAASYFSDTAQSWLTTAQEKDPTVAGFLYLSIASIAAGVTVSAVRWAVVDTIHHRTGVPAPAWDFAAYPGKSAAFDAIAEDHYRFYQYYANMFVAVAILYASLLAKKAIAEPLVMAAVFAAIQGFLFVGSRDALKKYYFRGSAILGLIQKSPNSNGTPECAKNVRSTRRRLHHSSPARFKKSASLMP